MKLNTHIRQSPGNDDGTLSRVPRKTLALTYVHYETQTDKETGHRRIFVDLEVKDGDQIIVRGQSRTTRHEPGKLRGVLCESFVYIDRSPAVK